MENRWILQSWKVLLYNLHMILNKNKDLYSIRVDSTYDCIAQVYNNINKFKCPQVSLMYYVYNGCIQLNDYLNYCLHAI